MTEPASPQTDTTPPSEPATTPDAVAPETSVLGGDLSDGAQEAPAAEAEADPAAPAADAEPVVTVPEKYELALDGMTIDAGLAEAADPVFRELGLSNDQANKLLPVAQQVMQRTQEAALQQLADAGAQQRKQWLDAFHADPDIGGAKADESTHLAARGLDALGFEKGHPFRQILTESGFGNHPDMIRAFRAIGEMVGEDGTFVRSGAGATEAKPVWERLYPNDAR